MEICRTPMVSFDSTRAGNGWRRIIGAAKRAKRRMRWIRSRWSGRVEQAASAESARGAGKAARAEPLQVRQDQHRDQNRALHRLKHEEGNLKLCLQPGEGRLE